MDVLDLFLREHSSVHSAAACGADDFNIDWLVADLTDEEWRARPHGLNPLAWTFWHLARVEDGCADSTRPWRSVRRIGRAGIPRCASMLSARGSAACSAAFRAERSGGSA
jgi:hypothetical protein